MICHEKSPIKLNEAQLANGQFFNFPCYDDLYLIMDNCGADLMEPMFETYRSRLLSGTQKPHGYVKIREAVDPYNAHKDTKVQHY